MSLHALIDIESLNDHQIEHIVERSIDLLNGAEPLARSHTMANLFFEPSTRTRTSFEIAARRLGLTVINMDGPRSSMTKGESLLDTLATLRAMGVELTVIRHGQTGICHEIVDHLPAGLSLINAGDGCGQHPTQALLDAATLTAQGVDLASAKVVIVGDLRHSRVARSNMRLLSRLGVAEIALAAPAPWMPEALPDGVKVTQFDGLDAALSDADVVMMLRVQQERMDEGAGVDWPSYHANWGLTAARLARAKPSCWVMHPGPMNRGIEITDEVANGERSLVLAQVKMSVCTRMAIFESMLA